MAIWWLVTVRYVDKGTTQFSWYLETRGALCFSLIYKSKGNNKRNRLEMLELEVVPERSLGCEQWEFILGKWRNTRDVSRLRRITRNFAIIKLIHNNLENEQRISVILSPLFQIELYWCCRHVSIRTLLFHSICKHLVWQSRVNKENGDHYEYFVAYYVIVYTYCLAIWTFAAGLSINWLIINWKLTL